MVNILDEFYPKYEHIFIYDNTTTHCKQPNNSLSAHYMPKNIPKEGTNWLVDRNIINPLTGNTLLGPDEKIVKEKICMCNTINPMIKEPQLLYFPEGHKREGIFKGMVEILVKRGFDRMKLTASVKKGGLKAACKGFHCPAGATDCCVRRIFFNQDDFSNVKSLLKEAMEKRGVGILFLPKFHCELNLIKQCWGYVKRLYRLNPESSKEADLEANTQKALKEIPLVSIHR